MRWPSVSIRRDRHTDRRAGRSTLRSPPDPPGVRNNHHDLECLAKSAEAIARRSARRPRASGTRGHSAIAGRASSRISVTWSAVGAKTSDLDGRSIAALPMLPCAREQTPGVRERAETAPAGITIQMGNPWQTPPVANRQYGSHRFFLLQSRSAANLPTTTTSFQSSWV